MIKQIEMDLCGGSGVGPFRIWLSIPSKAEIKTWRLIDENERKQKEQKETRRSRGSPE